MKIYFVHDHCRKTETGNVHRKTAARSFVDFKIPFYIFFWVNSSRGSLGCFSVWLALSFIFTIVCNENWSRTNYFGGDSYSPISQTWLLIDSDLSLQRNSFQRQRECFCRGSTENLSKKLCLSHHDLTCRRVSNRKRIILNRFFLSPGFKSLTVTLISSLK